ASSCRARAPDGGAGARHHPLRRGVAGGTLALQLAPTVTPPLRGLLGLVPMSAGDWALVAAGVAAPSLITEARRAFGVRPPVANDVHGGHHARPKATIRL